MYESAHIHVHLHVYIPVYLVTKIPAYNIYECILFHENVYLQTGHIA